KFVAEIFLNRTVNPSLLLKESTDLWTSPHNKGFISVTAHYIDEDWTLRETLINFSLLNRKHDGINISNGFFKVIKAYGITLKLLAITLDNAANNGTFVRELEIKLKNEENIEWNSE
ncbi:6908_t:CDS:2, partial [Gigaspora rosea]